MKNNVLHLFSLTALFLLTCSFVQSPVPAGTPVKGFETIGEAAAGGALPGAAVEGLKARHLVRAEMIIDCDRPVKAFARLNIRHGPNLAQPVSNLPDQHRDKVAEFDLAYAGLNDKRIERTWLDLILNDAAMSRIVIRDLVVSRRPRAEL